jgi:hypothetical protein
VNSGKQTWPKLGNNRIPNPRSHHHPCEPPLDFLFFNNCSSMKVIGISIPKLDPLRPWFLKPMEP